MVKLQLKSYMVAFPRPYPTKPYGCIYGKSMKNMISKINAGRQILKRSIHAEGLHSLDKYSASPAADPFCRQPRISWYKITKQPTHIN